MRTKKERENITKQSVEVSEFRKRLGLSRAEIEAGVSCCALLLKTRPFDSSHRRNGRSSLNWRSAAAHLLEGFHISKAAAQSTTSSSQVLQRRCQYLPAAVFWRLCPALQDTWESSEGGRVLSAGCCSATQQQVAIHCRRQSQPAIRTSRWSVMPSTHSSG